MDGILVRKLEDIGAAPAEIIYHVAARHRALEPPYDTGLSRAEEASEYWKMQRGCCSS